MLKETSIEESQRKKDQEKAYLAYLNLQVHSKNLNKIHLTAKLTEVESSYHSKELKQATEV